MLEIQIAGAGAGKTHELAQTIIKHINTINDHKVIFALTYTNSATEKIYYEILKSLGYIPNNVVIETVHSFLLNKIIYPFSFYILGDKYNNCSTIALKDEKNSYKGQKIKRLKLKNIIHSEKIYNISKQIIDENNRKHSNKEKKAKVRFILDLLQAKITKIFIDEVQDLDSDGLETFNIIAKKCSDVYMIGDPKQAIKYSNALIDFIRKVESETYVILHPINNVTRRVPSEILAISNRFCYPNQKQNSINQNKGILKYLESTHPQFIKIIHEYIKKHIVCIDKKQGRYSTSKHIKVTFPDFIEEKIKACPSKLDKNLLVKAAHIDFLEEIQQSNIEKAIQDLQAKYSFRLKEAEYAEFSSQFSKNPKNIFNISSIDSIKGLDSDSCVIILSLNIYNYLIQNNLPQKNKFNKVWKQVYVALTRAKQELIIVIDHELLEKENIDAIKIELEKLGFVPY